MILLDATTKSLQVLLGGVVTTNELVYVAGYADLSATGTTLGESDGLTNGATAVTPVAAPAASTVRKVTFLNIYNIDTASATVTVRVNNNGTFRTLAKVTLAAGYTLVMNNNGWGVVNASGALQSGSAGVSAHNILDSTVHTDALTGTVVRGDLIVGNATPKWARLAVGSAGRVLKADGTDAAWGQVVNADVDAAAAIAYSKLNLATSIVNADVAAAAAIAASKLVGAVQQVALTAISGDFTTTSTTLVDLTNATITITTKAGSTVLLLLTVPLKISTTADQALIDWNKDGSDDGSVQGVSANADWTTVTLFKRYTGLTAASHTFKVRCRTNGGNTLSSSMSSIMAGTLMAIEVSQ